MLNNPYRNRGALVDNDEFIGRDEILAECLALIVGGDTPQNITIYGDKWSGKSWLLRTVQRRLREGAGNPREYICVYLDVQGIGTPRAFYGRLSRELAGVPEAGRLDDAPSTLTDIVKRTSARVRAVVILDGFDAITRNPSFPVDFFSFLRSLPMTDGSRLSWFLSSTRPLREMCHSPAVQGSPFFNIFSERLLTAFTPDDSYRLIVGRSTAAGRTLAPYVDEIQQLAGRFPLFLQMACCYAFEQHQESNGAVDLLGISQKFREEIRPYVQHLWSQLSKVEQEILQCAAAGGRINHYAERLLRDLVRRGYLMGPSLDSGLYAFDCKAFLELARHVGAHDALPGNGTPTVRHPAPAPAKADLPDRRVRVFISYSHRNKRSFRQIFDYICSLSKDGVEFWFDDRLKAGDIWDERIKTEIARADVALVLASQEYFTSQYCMEVEAAEFVRSRVTDGMVIFPVLLSPCPFEDHEWLFKTHRLPREGTFAQIASTKAKRDALLMQILNDLRRITQDIRHRRTAAAT